MPRLQIHSSGSRYGQRTEVLEPGPTMEQLLAESGKRDGWQTGMVVVQTPVEPDGKRRVVAAWIERDRTRSSEEIALEWAGRLGVGGKISVCITTNWWQVFNVVGPGEIARGPKRALTPEGM